jgi:hypothetical protein
MPRRLWTGIAHDFGYYDQMHMVRDFEDFTGENPTAFIRRLDAMPESWAQHCHRSRRTAIRSGKDGVGRRGAKVGLLNGTLDRRSARSRIAVTTHHLFQTRFGSVATDRPCARPAIAGLIRKVG